MMKYTDVMKQLEKIGTTQNRKIYIRYGANPNKLFGVSFANLNKLSKMIKTNHTLAYKLWESGNYDARNLALKVGDPWMFTAKDADAWIKDINNYLHASELGSFTAKSPDRKKTLNKWTSSKKEFVKDAGYSMLGAIVKNDPDELTDSEVRKYLKLIENEIHSSPNWARYGMNWALISLGTYKANTTKDAIEVAKRIGKVEVDHGKTSCKTPDAATYIEKAVKHRKSKKK